MRPHRLLTVMLGDVYLSIAQGQPEGPCWMFLEIGGLGTRSVEWKRLSDGWRAVVGILRDLWELEDLDQAERIARWHDSLPQVEEEQRFGPKVKECLLEIREGGKGSRTLNQGGEKEAGP